MNIREIAEKWLMANGYDGLYCDDYGCGCEIDDLMPCDMVSELCSAGYRVPCPGPEDCPANGDCPWHIQEKRSK